MKDKAGRIVIWQWPNALLTAWLVLKLATMLLQDGRLDSGLRNLSSAVLFAWAYLEITQGVIYFRKGLGVVVMLIIMINYFR